MSMPARLDKKENMEQKIRFFILKNYMLLLVIGMISASILFVMVCYACVPPTESGTFYNHLGDIS